MSQTTNDTRGWQGPAYLLIGLFFGIVLIKSEVVSWYRIQEMFRFQSFFMYGVLGSAIATALVSIRLLRSRPALDGSEIELAPKAWGKGARVRYLAGGSLFGLGWGLVGSCPGPIYALIGQGTYAAIVVLLAALAGTWTYAALRDRLPH